MGQKHLIDEMRQCGKIACCDLKVIIHLPGQGKGLKDLRQIGQKPGKPFGIVAVMGGKRDGYHHQQPQPHFLTVDIGPISADDLVIFKPRTTARALRCRKSDPLRQVIVGQAAVLLQFGQQFKV